MHVGKADDARGDLRDDRRNGRAGHAHSEPGHKGEVKHDVQNRGDEQEIERGLAVAQRAQQRGRDIIPELEHEARGVDAEIQQRQRQQRLRRAERARKQESRAADADERHQKPHRQHQHDGCRGILPQLLLPRSAEILRDQHARADGKADGERGKQNRQRRAGAHGGQRLLAVEIADNDGVGGVIQLLQQIPRHDRQGKLHNELPGRSPGQVLGHDAFFSGMINDTLNTIAQKEILVNCRFRLDKPLTL